MTMQLPKWWKILLQDSADLNKHNLWQQQGRQAAACDLTWLTLSKILYLFLFRCINYHLAAKYKTEKLIAK